MLVGRRQNVESGFIVLVGIFKFY